MYSVRGVKTTAAGFTVLALFLAGWLSLSTAARAATVPGWHACRCSLSILGALALGATGCFKATAQKEIVGTGTEGAIAAPAAPAHRTDRSVAVVHWNLYETGYEESQKRGRQALKSAFGAPDNHFFRVSPRGDWNDLGRSLDEAFAKVATEKEPKLVLALESHGSPDGIAQENHKERGSTYYRYDHIFEELLAHAEKFRNQTGKSPQVSVLVSACYSGRCLNAVADDDPVRANLALNWPREIPLTVVATSDDFRLSYRYQLWEDMLHHSINNPVAGGLPGPVPSIKWLESKGGNTPVIWSNHLPIRESLRQSLREAKPSDDLSGTLRNLRWHSNIYSRDGIDLVVPVLLASQSEATREEGYRWLARKFFLGDGLVSPELKAKIGEDKKSFNHRLVVAAVELSLHHNIEEPTEVRHQEIRQLMRLARSGDSSRRADISEVLLKLADHLQDAPNKKTIADDLEVLRNRLPRPPDTDVANKISYEQFQANMKSAIAKLRGP